MKGVDTQTTKHEAAAEIVNIAFQVFDACFRIAAKTAGAFREQAREEAAHLVKFLEEESE